MRTPPMRTVALVEVRRGARGARGAHHRGALLCIHADANRAAKITVVANLLQISADGE
jgi:hypothetical protein